ncbi:AraC-type DNA-binding protein [Saccharicrinis carchari]|uniref:AraC-type DNA-binding protein n=2 Tax=Saccharicrinis carchari TaxID=1168039 RepID=A0A521APR4_SACCC|nr:AraC-type DNA-binding protein [Saccharicrinis carchari]
MVCKRCIKVIKDELSNLGIEVESIELGQVIVKSPLNEPKLSEVRKMLHANEFELIDDKKSKLIERIKTLIIERIQQPGETSLNMTSSEIISKEIGYDYSYLSHLFSSVEGITIERYIINQKIEKAKELLVYNEFTLSEIAFQLGYSSVQHLSSQFKKVTGLTPSHFKTLKGNKRKPLDMV